MAEMGIFPQNKRNTQNGRKRKLNARYNERLELPHRGILVRLSKSRKIKYNFGYFEIIQYGILRDELIRAAKFNPPRDSVVNRIASSAHCRKTFRARTRISRTGFCDIMYPRQKTAKKHQKRKYLHLFFKFLIVIQKSLFQINVIYSLEYNIYALCHFW